MKCQAPRCLIESATPVGLEIVRITSPKGCCTYGGGKKACSHLSEEERQVIRIEIGNGTIIRRIGLMLGRNASTVGREIERDTWFPSNENES